MVERRETPDGRHAGDGEAYPATVNRIHLDFTDYQYSGTP